MTTSELARVICCEGQDCLKPDACDAGREFRVPISPHKAAEAVRVAMVKDWQTYRGTGPMTVIREAPHE